MFNQNYDLSINPLSFGYASSDNVKTLDKDEILVFGSDLAGNHDKCTICKFGAEKGVGEGLQGQAYAIPVKDDNQRTLFLKEIKNHINKFISYAGYNQEYNFLVTKIGCGLSGYKVSDIAPLFADSVYFKNIHLPKEFLQYLLAKYYP